MCGCDRRLVQQPSPLIRVGVSGSVTSRQRGARGENRGSTASLISNLWVKRHARHLAQLQHRGPVPVSRRQAALL